MCHEWNLGCTIKIQKEWHKNYSKSAYRSLSSGRHFSRLGTPYNDCKSCQEVEDEKTITHLLCEYKALYKERNAIIGRDFLDDVSDVIQIKIIKGEDFSPGGSTIGLLSP